MASCSPANPASVAPVEPAVSPAEPTGPVGLVLPTRFEADRIFLELKTAQGEPLRMYTDTGGGLYLLDAVAQRLGLPLEAARGEGDEAIEVVTLPPLDPSTAMPPVLVLDGRLPVARQAPFGDIFGDGMLGAGWFRDRVWTFDYDAETLVLHEASLPCDGSLLPLGFAEYEGRRTAHYPRVQATIDGRVHDLLFDSGATVLLTEPGLAGLNDGGPTERATSFIVRSIFERWRAAHPDWRVIEGADRMGGDPMIEVPEVTLGELVVGPVWFTAREDPNFREFMSQWMDREIDGALGGSALAYLRVTLDYPRAEVCLSAP
ncbi:MAG: hypothetical protein AAF799_39705 [Myxococcota bacterium]